MVQARNNDLYKYVVPMAVSHYIIGYFLNLVTN